MRSWSGVGAWIAMGILVVFTGCGNGAAPASLSGYPAGEAVSVKDRMQEIDEQIMELTESEEYLSADEEGREELARHLLDQCIENGMLADYSFSSEDHLFSFTYPDGSAGGIYLRDFQTRPGAIPTN